MRTAFPIFTAMCLAMATPVAADDCADQITALFMEGALDPLAIPSRHSESVNVAPDGTTTPIVIAHWETASRVQSVSNGNHIIAIGSETWMSNSADGPWTAAGATLPEDVEAFHREMSETTMRNATEMSCPGNEMLDGREVTKYIYRSVSDPNEYGSWFGALNTVYVDVEWQEAVRLEAAESIASWAPEKSKDVMITTIEFDPTIKVERPE